MSFLGFFGKRQSPNASIPDALPGDSFDQAFKPYATNPDKPSAWGEGGKAWQILGIVGDALSAADGRQGVYLPAMLDMRQQTQKERQFLAQLQAKSASDRADKVWERDLDISRPKPTAEMQNFGAYEGMSPERRAAYGQYQDLHNPIVRQGNDGLPYAYSRPPAAGTVVAAPWLSQGQGDAVTPQSAAPILSGAASSQAISPQDAARVRASLGPNGQAAFEEWMRKNNIVIGGQ